MCDRCDVLAAKLAMVTEALEAWRWADRDKGAPVGDSRVSREASLAAIARTNAELFDKARALTGNALAATSADAEAAIRAWRIEGALNSINSIGVNNEKEDAEQAAYDVDCRWPPVASAAERGKGAK